MYNIHIIVVPETVIYAVSSLTIPVAASVAMQVKAPLFVLSVA